MATLSSKICAGLLRSFNRINIPVCRGVQQVKCSPAAKGKIKVNFLPLIFWKHRDRKKIEAIKVNTKALSYIAKLPNFDLSDSALSGIPQGIIKQGNIRTWTVQFRSAA